MRVLRNLSSLDKIINRRRERKDKIAEKVTKIIREVEQKGDAALLGFTKKYDKVNLSPKNLLVTESEISAAFNELNSELISALKVSIDNVYKFYRSQIPRSTKKKDANGKKVRVKYRPLQRVGVYVPAGSAPLVSSVYMSVIPALVAGVKEVVLASPPTKDKFINPFILAVASMLKIKKIYKMGGAQAISALAFGTKTVDKVDKIVGPGNEFVTEAKRQVFGKVGIDMLAGPSEIVIIAGRNANTDYILADLDAQIEHKDGLGIVVTNSKKIVRQLRGSKIRGFIVKVKNLDQAAKIVNMIAPEHLEIFTKKPSSILKNINNCSAIFVGENSPVALGDYTAGPSHVLPTAGGAKIFSSLSVRDFMKEIHVVSYTKKAVSEEFPTLEKIASLEGMSRHIESVRKRLQ
jgi:histidinol dehydrogenase